MIENYKEYNNISQQDKESAIAKASENSNQNESTLIANTDQVESLLSTISGRLASIETALSTLNTSVQGTTQEVATQGQAIVQALGQ